MSAPLRCSVTHMSKIWEDQRRPVTACETQFAHQNSKCLTVMKQRWNE